MPSRSDRVSTAMSMALLTAAGGALDAWVYTTHGHVFANAQSGNVVLLGIALSSGDLDGAARHVPSLLAFAASLIGSSAMGRFIRRRGGNARTPRLMLECLGLTGLAFVAGRLPEAAVTGCVGALAALQITSLSHLGAWSFNTGMTTGNLRSAAVALVAWLNGDVNQKPHAAVMSLLCVSFLGGAMAGGWLAPRLGDATLLCIAALIAAGAWAIREQPDPLPDWSRQSDVVR